jgi:MFS family permease
MSLPSGLAQPGAGTGDGPGADAISAVPLASWWTLLVLLLMGLYTIADRPMVSLQVEALRKDLLLSDFQVGMVQGVSVALFAAVAGYPLAWLADRFDPRVVLAGAVAVWSGSLAMSAFSRSFEELFLFNALVGAGEACLVPISLALVPQFFQGRQRHLANSIMMIGGRLGAGLIIALCGWLVLAVDTWRHLLPEGLQSLATWRLSLLAIALPGVLLLPLILLLPLPRKPPRASAAVPTARLPGAPAAVAAPPGVLRYVRENAASFAFFFGGVAMLVMAISSLAVFTPVVAMRQMGATAAQAGGAMGAATMAATVAAFLVAQFAYWRLVPRFGQKVAVMFMVAAAVGAALVMLSLPLATTYAQLFWIYGLFFMVMTAGILLSPTILQDITPAPLRARLAAITVTMNIVLGALGPPVVGAVSDQLKGRPDGLLLAMAGTAFVCLVIAALLLRPMVGRYVAAVAAARRAEEQHRS